jgi:predicted ferric reductase
VKIVKAKLGYFFIVASLIVTFNLWVMGAPNFQFYLDNPLLGFAKFAALLGTVLLCYEFIFASRWGFLEYIFGGQDKVYKLHHIIGGLAFVLILQHPLFLILNALPNTALASRYLIPNSDLLGYTFGISAFYIMLILLAFTLFVKLPYRTWKATHIFMSLPLFLTMLHIFFVDGVVRNYLPLTVWMFGFTFIAAFAFIYKRLIYPVAAARHQYEISNLIQHDDTIEIWLDPIGEPISFKPGQYAFVKFSSKAVPSDEHPFSFAGYSDDGVVRFVIKNLGDFTSKLKNLEVGDRADLIGPHGSFANAYLHNVAKPTHTQKEMILIGGGVGITPVLSILDHAIANDVKTSITLYYATVKVDEAFLEDEIKAKGKNLENFRYYAFPEETKGFLSAEQIIEDTGENLRDKLIFVCGPPGMMYALRTQFINNNVPEKNINMEDFGFK